MGELLVSGRVTRKKNPRDAALWRFFPEFSQGKSFPGFSWRNTSRVGAFIKFDFKIDSIRNFAGVQFHLQMFFLSKL